MYSRGSYVCMYFDQKEIVMKRYVKNDAMML